MGHGHDGAPAVDAEIQSALAEILTELEQARRKFPAFHSTHEGYAVILEELDELWDDVRGNQIRTARREAAQVAAMALRFMLDCCSANDGCG